jgi:hypothetical protein
MTKENKPKEGTEQTESPEEQTEGAEQDTHAEQMLALIKEMQKQQDEFNAKLNKLNEQQALLVKSGAVVREYDEPEPETPSDEEWLSSIDINKLDI